MYLTRRIEDIRNWWRGQRKNADKARVIKDTIKCWCGYDTGLNKNGFLMVIPEGGLICPKCKSVIIQDNRPIMWAKKGEEYKSCCLS